MAAHDGEETGNRRQGKCMLEIIIPGKPIAKKRPRFARRGKCVTTYSEQETEESKIMAQILAQLGKDWKPIETPVLLDMEFCFPFLKSHYGSGKNSDKIKASAPIYHTQKPDVDNLVKFVMDCMNEIVFRDDAQVVTIAASKKWDRDARSIIRIKTLTDTMAEVPA